MQGFRLRRRDRSAAAAIHANVSGTPLAQLVDEVLEELHVAALIGRNRDGVGVFL